MNNTVPSKIPSVVDHVLNKVETVVRESGKNTLSDEQLLVLHSAFGAVLQRALDILEKSPTLVSYTTSNKLRSLIEIKGENDRCYRIFPRINFCPCKAFKHQVVERKSQVCCKHVLAGEMFFNNSVGDPVTQSTQHKGSWRDQREGLASSGKDENEESTQSTQLNLAT